MIQIGGSLMAVSDPYNDLLAILTDDGGPRFVQVTDALTGKPWAVSRNEITLFRPAMRDEADQIAQMRAKHSGITLPGDTIAMPQSMR